MFSANFNSKPPRASAPAARARSTRKGFTILEVMCAAAVMTFAITSSITVMQRGFLSLDTARNLTIAGQIMQYEMENLRMKDWGVVGAYPTAATTVTIDPSFTSNPAVGSRFTLTRAAAAITMPSGLGMREITFTVAWKSYDGRTLSRSYISYYGQNGLYDYYYNSI